MEEKKRAKKSGGGAGFLVSPKGPGRGALMGGVVLGPFHKQLMGGAVGGGRKKRQHQIRFKKQAFLVQQTKTKGQPGPPKADY